MVGSPLNFSRAAVGPGVAALGLQMTTSSGAQAFSSSEAPRSLLSGHLGAEADDLELDVGALRDLIQGQIDDRGCGYIS